MRNIQRRTRPDRAKATIVNAGIIMAGLDGRAAAAQFLERERVPFRVIVRVLAEPGPRRAQVAPEP
jgi:hypothetical protein